MNYVLSYQQELILKGKVCQYCGKETRLVDSKVIYKRSYGLMYLCKKCNAYCGVHKDTSRSLGSVANKELREWRKITHNNFDVIWKHKIMDRNDAYQWLSIELDLEEDYTHIGMFQIDTCKKVVRLCKSLLLRLRELGLYNQ